MQKVLQWIVIIIIIIINGNAATNDKRADRKLVTDSDSDSGMELFTPNHYYKQETCFLLLIFL